MPKLDNSKTTAETDKPANAKGAPKPAKAQVAGSERSGTPRPQPSTENTTPSPAPPNTPKPGVPATSPANSPTKKTPQQTAGSDFTQ